MKRYIRFGPPDIDSEQDSNPRKVRISTGKKKGSKPQNLSDTAFTKKLKEIKEHIAVDNTPYNISTLISALKKFDLTSDQQAKLNEVQKLFTDAFKD